jgi:chromate transport protein ChrA
VALAIVAFIALWKYKVDVIWVIVASALLGLLGFQGSVA